MYLGVDVGTSAVKAVVADDGGQIVAQSSAGLGISRPHELWSEQDPGDWWAATNKAVSDLAPAVRRSVQAIGLSGQMHGATLLDASGVALRPAILWNDGRSNQECDELERALPELPSISGNRAMPGFTGPKLAWTAKHEPQIFEQVASVLLPKDYIRLRMTGDSASDMSDAAGTLWLDVKQRDWSDELLSVCGLSRSQMPKLYEGNEVTGMLRPEVAEAWGMRAVPVVAGGGDNAAGAIGVGVLDEGDAFLSLGTSGVLFVANNEFRPNPQGGVHTFCHAIAGRWHQMSVILSAASCMDWAAKSTGARDAARLFAAAELKGANEDVDEIFLPYLSGERTPHNNPNAKGVLFGLSHDTGQAEIARAVMEGVAFAFCDGLDALADAGTKVDQVTVIGGGAKSNLWGEILASAMNIRLVYRTGGEVGPAYGAARLAHMASAGSDPREVASVPPISNIVEPDERLRERLAPKLETYRALYKDLSSFFGGSK